MKSYSAHIWKEENDTYSVEFPDLPGCFSSAKTLEEAKRNASDALTAYLETCDSRKVSIPLPQEHTGNDMYEIEPSLSVAFAITLKQAREQKGLTQKQIAEKLGVQWAAYQRLENPRKSNPTLATIGKLQRVFNRAFILL